VLATGNAGKLAEMRAILASHDLEVVPQSVYGISPPVEDGADYIANALIKARHAAAQAGLPAIADDSGLEVDALGGRPGLHSARYASPAASARDNNELLLAELAGIPEGQRTARYRCAMVFVRDAADPLPVIAEAAWEGRIGLEPRGLGGFGFDPLFIVDGDSRTAAEMPAEEKNRVSHRGQALTALAVQMREAGW
jgi:XTP/dITP diphosphohydrolase